MGRVVVPCCPCPQRFFDFDFEKKKMMTKKAKEGRAGEKMAIEGWKIKRTATAPSSIRGEAPTTWKNNWCTTLKKKKKKRGARPPRPGERSNRGCDTAENGGRDGGARNPR